MAEMHAWEAEMPRRHKTRDWENSTDQDTERDYAEMRGKLAAIFARYCADGEKARRVSDVCCTSAVQSRITTRRRSRSSR